jgi:hypothetical protein
MELWAKPSNTITVQTQNNGSTVATGASGQRYVLFPQFIDGAGNAGAGISLGTNGVGVYEHSASYLAPLLTQSVSISSTLFSHIVVVYTNRQPSLYINNSFIKTGLTSLRTTVFYNKENFIAGIYGLFSGQIANVKIYSKSLTATEISQNFDALRDRYGV